MCRKKRSSLWSPSDLVYRIFVVGFEFIESYDVPDGEEDEEGGEDKSDDVGESGESKRHLYTPFFRTDARNVSGEQRKKSS